MALQLRLNKILAVGLTVDGDFAAGGFTERAVKRFKSESNNDKLRADRENPVVGPLTVRELGLEKPKSVARPSVVLGDLLTLELYADQRVSTEKGRVSAWADARDGKIVAVQPDEGARPRLTTEKTIRFTSSNAAVERCFLEIPHTAVLSPGEDDFRVLVIARSRTMQTTSPSNTLIQKGQEYQIRLERIRADAMGTVFQAASAEQTHEETTASNLGGAHLYELAIRNGKVSAVIDGVALPGETPFGPPAKQKSPLHLGGVNRGVDLFAVLVIKGAATDQQLTDVRTYLTDLYRTPFTPQAVAPAGSEQTKVVQTTGSARARIPAIVRCNDNSLVLFAEYRWDGSEDTGHIGVVARRSTDHGATWGPQFTVVDDGENTLGNPVPIVDRSTGRLHLLLTGNLAVDQASEINKGTSVDTRRVYRTFSDDNGQTWAPRIEITKDVKDPSWRWYATGPGGAEQLSSGRLLVACNHYDPARSKGRSHVIFSDDHGETWQRGGIIETDGTNEIQTAELSSGSLVAHIRLALHNNPPGWKYWATSEDQGKTWTAATRNYNLPSTPVQDDILVLPDGRLVATNHQDFKGRYNLAVNVSDDEGRTWPAYTVIRTGKVGSGAGYADLVHTGEGRLAAIWESGREISVQLFDVL